MKVVLLGLLGNLALLLLFAFGNWNINPECWDSVSRVICTVLMGAVTFMTFAYFIFELSNKK